MSSIPFVVAALLLACPFESLAQSFTFLAEQVAGSGDGLVTVKIVDPALTTGNDYRLFFTRNEERLSFSVENLTQQKLVFQGVQVGEESPVFEGMTIRVTEGAPQIKDLVEVRYGDLPVEPPAHVFRPGDLQRQGGSNSTGEYTFVGGFAPGDYKAIVPYIFSGAPFDYEIRFDYNFARNRLIYSFGPRIATVEAPFSIWNIGNNTPADTSDDYQVLAVAHDQILNTVGFAGGLPPGDDGSGTMYDLIFIHEINRFALPRGDLNRDGSVDYSDFLRDVEIHGDTIVAPQIIRLPSRPYGGPGIVRALGFVSLTGNPTFLPPKGTTIRILSTKPPQEQDVFTFSTQRFGMFTRPMDLNFGGVQAGSSCTVPLKIFNPLHRALNLSAVFSSAAAVQVSQQAFILAAGDSAVLEVVFSPLNEGAVEGSLTIRSDDPFFPEYRLTWRGEGLPFTQGAARLLGRLTFPSLRLTDVWGYVDSSSGKEYALLGHSSGGISIVDASDPRTPKLAAQLFSIPGIDIKSWKHYVYSVTGDAGIGAILDMSDPTHPKLAGEFPSSHNLFIDDRGFMYLAFPDGLHIFDLNPDPTKPVAVWSGGTYGHDAAVIGNRLYDFHGFGGTFIYDVSDRAHPQLLGAITDPAIGFHHSGWTSKDGHYLFLCDEAARHPTPDLTVWDVSDGAHPRRVGSFNDPESAVHNLYVIDDFAYISYYTAGYRVLDVSDPQNPKLAGEFDTDARLDADDLTQGAFGVYPFAPSGNIYVSDSFSGLFIFAPVAKSDAVDSPFEEMPISFALAQNYPNPFNPETEIVYELPRAMTVEISVFNLMGIRIRDLINMKQKAGRHQVLWDGRNDLGREMSSGLYFYRMRAGGLVQVKRMLLLR
ncbi:MAG: choice-of-anchor B family protein [bacterium]